MCVTKCPSPRPAGLCQGNIPLLSAPLTKQNCSTVKTALRTSVYMSACVATSVCLSTGRQWSVTAWSLRPWRVMEREQASCSIWPHGRTQKRKGECWREIVSIYDVCCMSKPPFYHRSPCSDIARFSPSWAHIHTHIYTYKVTGFVCGLPEHSEWDNEMCANFSGVMDWYE